MSSCCLSLTPEIPAHHHPPQIHNFGLTSCISCAGNNRPRPSVDAKNQKDADKTGEPGSIATKTFTFRELATATKNFRQECLLGEGGFGRVFKGTLQTSGQVVAVKQLDRNGVQGSKEFLVEVLMLSLLHHPNLLNLIGYCADGDQRLLVYEYMPAGSLEDHLLDISADKKPLDWVTRMKIASGAAQGLEYLHEKANPPVIYRVMKSSNILLDEEFNPRLTDFGLAKLGHDGSKMPVPSRVMATYGYCAPEYERSGELTLKSDVYCFGVVLLELITGRRAVDTTRPTAEQNLVTWAQPIFRDPIRFPEMADPLLKREFPVRSLNQAVGVAAMCLQEEASVRPLITDVVAALSFLAFVPPDADVPSDLPTAPTPPLELEISAEHEEDHHHPEDGDISDHLNRDSSDHEDADNSAIHHPVDQTDHKASDYEEDGGSSESLYDEDGDSDDDGPHQKDVDDRAKLIASSSSLRKSKVESQDGSIYSSSSSSSSSKAELSHNRNVDKGNTNGFECQDGSAGSCSRQSSDLESWDGSVGSSSKCDSNMETRDGSTFDLIALRRKIGSMRSQDGSVGSHSTHSSDLGSEDGTVGSSLRHTGQG
ncbi:hypothetical protein RJ639_020700 [Escallonia herrerae]|uniref:Protein kinase domain-containing protein n=1 Tax=Escallonia herrerae TaxID=1293975 RepID=A0AA88V427_9ASTE|nr:hypothetical protein RJ639_020700 [Escallonia herrerae]